MTLADTQFYMKSFQKSESEIIDFKVCHQFGISGML